MRRSGRDNTEAGRRDTSSSRLPAPPRQAAAVGPRGVAWLEVWGIGFRARRIATRVLATPLWSAYLIHVVSVLLTLGVLFVLVAWEDAPIREDSLDVSGSARRLAGRLSDLYAFDPRLSAIVLLSMAAAVEAAYVILAVITMAWGARNEPIGVTFRFSLQRTWLSTALWPSAVAVAGSVIVWSQRGIRFYCDRAPADEPWLARWQPAICVGSAGVAGLWMLWAFLRFVGAWRPSSAEPRPPTCEWCGYNLTHVPTDGRCSECGKPAEASLGEHIRTGPAWTRRRSGGRLAAWWDTLWCVMIAPGEFGRQLKLDPESDDHRALVAWHIPASFLLGALGACCMLATVGGWSGFTEHVPEVIAATLVLGCLTVTTIVTIIALTSSAVGIAFHYLDRRNLMSVSIQAASCLSTYVVAWSAVAHGMVVLLSATHRTLRQLAILIGVDPDTLIMLAWCVPNLVLLVGYFSLVARATAAARYANR